MIAARDQSQLKEEMLKASAYMQSLPTTDLWLSIRPQLEEERAVSFERSWLAIAYRLNDIFSGSSSCPPEACTAEENKFLEVYADYYTQLGLLLCEALPYLRQRFEEGKVGTTENSHQTTFCFTPGDFLKELIHEDCIGAIKVNFLTEFWESPSQKEAKELWTMCTDYQKGIATIEGKVCSVEKLSEENWLQLNHQIEEILKKLNWHPEKESPCWTSLCEEVFKAYKDNLPSFLSWVNAKEKKFYREPWKKHFIQEGKRINYSGRGTSKKTSS